MRRNLNFLAFLFCACVFTFGAPVQNTLAQTGGNPVSITAEAGFGGYGKSNHWIPLRLTVENSGDPIEGELVLLDQKTTDDVRRYTQLVSLAKGSRKQITLYVPASSSSFEVKLMHNGTEIAKATPAVRSLGDTDRVIVVLSDPPDAFNFLGDLRVPYGGRTVVTPMRPDQLPDRTAAWDSVDILVLNNADTTALNKNQHAALRGWVNAGGMVLLNGGSGAALSLGGFADVAPAVVGTNLIGGSPQAFRAFIAPSTLNALPDDLVLNVPAVELQLKQGARALIAAKETPLVAKQIYGNGAVVQLAFDATLAPLRDWAGRAALFNALIGGRVDLPGRVGSAHEGSSPMQAASALPAAALPSVLLIAGFLLAYVLVIGPLNYIVLRRLKKLAWAWLSIPAIVLAFTSAGLLTGFRLRGGAPQTHRLNVVMGDERLLTGRNFAIVGLFAPRRTQVNVELVRTLAESINEVPFGGQPDLGTTTFSAGEPSTMNNMIIGGSEIRGVYARGESALPPIQTNLQLVLKPTGFTAVVEGTVTNSSNQLLKDCVLFVGKDYAVFGDIAAGATAKASAQLFLGKPQPAMSLRNSRLGRDRYYRGSSYSSSSTPRFSGPPSASPSYSGGMLPFDVVGEPPTSGLVNWRTAGGRGNDFAREAQNGLVTTVLGDDHLGLGAQVACWTASETFAAGIGNNLVTRAENTDHSLLIWRVPLETALAKAGDELPTDVFAWDVVASTSSVGFGDQGLSLEPGQHILDLSPWLDLRTNSTAISLTVTPTFETSSSISALNDVSLAIYNWREQRFVPVVEGVSTLTYTDTFDGDYWSPSGQIRLRFNVKSDTVTLSDLLVRVKVKE